MLMCGIQLCRYDMISVINATIQDAVWTDNEPIDTAWEDKALHKEEWAAR